MEVLSVVESVLGLLGIVLDEGVVVDGGHLCTEDVISLKSKRLRLATELVTWTHLPLQYSCSQRRKHELSSKFWTEEKKSLSFPRILTQVSCPLSWYSVLTPEN